MEQQVDTRSVVFTDLVGSTELRVRLGEETADELRRRHDDLLHGAVAGAGGVVVKGLGDGILATFSSAADAVAGAVAIQQAVDVHGRENPGLAFAVRVGISVGDVSIEESDVFGVPVVEASRLCAMANAGEILAAELVRALGRGRGGHSYEPMGDLELKGIPEPVPACRVLWEPVEVAAPAGLLPLPPALSVLGATAYVGRAELVARLRAGWEAARAGSTRTVLLAGEPGIGKTRTASEIARMAHADSAVVLFGRCEEGLAVPYQPFAEALEWYVTNTERPELGRLPGELTRLVPALRELVPGLPDPVRADAGTEEHRLFEAVSSWLAQVSVGGGLLLVLDDLHWAAKPTLLMLLHVLRAAAEQPGVRLEVVATYRDTDIDRTHPLSGVLADLRRIPGVERLPVQGLDYDEVVALLAAAAGHPMEEEGLLLARVVHDETEGNPFFAVEVVRHLVESGAIRRTEDRWVAVDVHNLSVPEGVRDVVGRRLSRLSDRANEVLTHAAVVGRTVDLDVLCALSGLGEDEVLDAIDEAVRARLVEEAGPEQFRFSHALVRTTLYDELSATRRRRAHRRVADVLEKLHPGDVVALAYHCIEGGPEGGDLTRAVRYAMASAEQALSVRATADAEERFRQVLELLEDADPDEAGHERRRALCGVGECRRDQAFPDHRELLLEVAAQAKAAGDLELMVRAVLANQRGLVAIVGLVDAERVAMIEEALDAVGPEPSPWRAELLALLASELAHDLDVLRRFPIAEEAIAMARQLGDRALLGRVLVGTRVPMLSGPRWRRFLEESAEAVALAEESGDPVQQFFAHLWNSQGLFTAAHIEDADAELARAVELAADGSPTVQWLATAYAVRPLLARGDFDEAGRLIDRAVALAARANQPDGLVWGVASMAIIHFWQGRFGALAETFRVAADNYPGLPTWSMAHVLALAADGRMKEARAAFEATPALAVIERLGEEILPFYALSLLGEIVGHLEDAALATAIAEYLEPYADCWCHYLLAPLAPASYVIGQCHLVAGRPETAIGYLEQAQAELERTGYYVPLVATRLEQARAALG